MIVQLRMLSGRYRVGSLVRRFSSEISGLCELCNLETEDITHLLVPRCLALQDRKAVLIDYGVSLLQQSPIALDIFNEIFFSDESTKVQFILDCSVLPQVIRASQFDKNILALLFRFTRTYCYSLHRTRLKLLNRWSA